MFEKMIRSFLILGCVSGYLLMGLSGSAVNLRAQEEEKPLRFGVAAMISPKETAGVYQQILYYVSEKLGRKVEMVQRKTYAEMDELLRTRNVEIAFICAGPYVSDHDNFKAELLAAPQAYGEAVYYSYIIVPIDSPLTDFEKLRGKKFAFTDPKSNTGYLVPAYMLAKMGETPDSFFAEYVYSGDHGISIEKVAGKEVDGAAVDHLIWEYLNAAGSTFTPKTKVLVKSPPYGMPPVVVHPDMDPQLKLRIQDILLNMHNDENGKKILKKIFIDKFIVPQDSNYDTIREMNKWVKKAIQPVKK